MPLSQLKTKARKLGADLIAFSKLERILAVVCMGIPALLVWSDGGNIRCSISDYVSMTHSHLFGLLLGIAAMLFIVNGAIYINKENIRHEKKQGRWYNIVLGTALLGVVVFPCTIPDVATLHIVSAGIFFGGSALVIALFNDKEHKVISRVIAALSIVSFVVYFLNCKLLNLPQLNWFTLFWAEWISMAVIGIHYILESLGELT